MRRAMPMPPGALAPLATTLRGERAQTDVTSLNVSPKRRSGLSLPYVRMASSYGTRGNGVAIFTPSVSCQIAANSPSTAMNTSSSVTKLISMSICVCSGWRSARRSSSRRQRASWKYRSQPLIMSVCL